MLNLLGVTTVIEGTELTGLPECYLARVSTISCRLYSECRFQIMCRLSRPILLRMNATMGGMEPTGPPEYFPAEWSTNWGCFPKNNMLRAVTTNVWIASSDLFECRLAWWSTIELDVVRRAHIKWLQSQGEVHPSSLLQQWFNTMKCNSMNVFLFSVLKKKKIKDVICMRTDDGRQRVEEPHALIPDVGSAKAVSAESWTTSSDWLTLSASVKAYTQNERKK